MNRIEFISELRKSLSGQIGTADIQNTVNYYEDYIDTQIKKGKTEAEVMDALGDPRLIAKSVKAAKGGTTAAGAAYSNDRMGQDSSGSVYGSDYGTQQNDTHRVHPIRLPGWLIGILTVLIIFAIIAIAFSLFIYLLPIILLFVGVSMLYRWLKTR